MPAAALDAQGGPGSVNITTSKPLAPGAVILTFTFGGVTQEVPVDIPPSVDSEKKKRAAILLALMAKGFDVGSSGPGSITVGGLRPGTQVVFSSITTGEGLDRLVAAKATTASFTPSGTFNPFDPTGALSTFNLSFVSNLGQASVSLTSAQFPDLLPQTISTTLFGALLPLVSPIGVNLSLTGSQIDAFFDQSLTSGGIGFGTTSGSGTMTGSITLSAVPEPSTPTLLATGVIAVLALARRRRSV